MQALVEPQSTNTGTGANLKARLTWENEVIPRFRDEAWWVVAAATATNREAIEFELCPDGKRRRKP